MTQGPLITIVTVTRNAAATIEATMQSVASQTFTDYEHIVMDGASTDSTAETARRLASPRTRIYSEADHGLYDAMNKALALARGSYVMFLNAGDTFADINTLTRIADAAKTHNPDIIYGQTLLVDAEGRVTGRRHLEAPPKLDHKSFRNGMVVCHQAFVVKRSIAPLYDLKYRFSADYEWCIRCLQSSTSNHYAGPEPLIHYLNQGLTTRNHKKSLAERFRIMAAYYGTLPTVARHAAFTLRALKRKVGRRKPSQGPQK